MYENIPEELKKLRCWVISCSDKVPKNPRTGKNAMTTEPNTWGTFEEAINGLEKYHYDQIGFVFDGKSGYFGVDLDHCVDNVDLCDEFVETLQSYAEYSKSGDGIHIICKGQLPSGSRRKNGIEMYDSGRYFICTGNIYNPKYRTVEECSNAIKVLHTKYLPSNEPKVAQREFVPISMDDQEVIEKAQNCKTGYVFSMLYQGKWQGHYSSQSEADLAFCNQLAFWTQRNEVQMDRIFRSSGLMRPKWDSKRSGTTYGAITIGRACANCMEVYEPRKYEDDTKLAFALFKDGTMGIQAPKKQYDMTDTGNAHRLSDKFGSIIHYSYNRKKWYYWDGKLWRIDDSGEIKKLADIICEDIKKEAMQEQDEKTQADMLKWAVRTSSSSGKEAMIKECQHLDGIPASPDEFDSYGDYINCQNGIVNLRNGELLPHDSNFMMSKICYSEYDVTKKEPKLWLSFLDDITGGNKELQDYLQRCVGYSLTGSTAEQCAYFLYGMGNNGKSTFLDTIAELFGGYASNVQPETIMMKRYSEGGALSDIARLKSARFVTSEEPTEGVRLNEGLIKQLTGGSRITCRFLYGEEFEYTPEFKIWIATNHKPIIRGTDLGIWRRIKMIPFEVTIPKEKVDKNLKYKLRKEFPQILAWAVQGCIKWRENGLTDPIAITEAVKEYKNEMDLLAGFIDEHIEIDYGAYNKVYASELFREYSKWAKENNEYEMSSKKFFSEISKKLPEKARDNKGVFFRYIKLIKPEERQYRASDFRRE